MNYFPFFFSGETDIQFIASETFCFIPQDLRSSPWGSPLPRLVHSSGPCELGGLGTINWEEFPGSQPRSKAKRRFSGESETKGFEIPNLLTL